jgi:hypothetical protein
MIEELKKICIKRIEWYSRGIVFETTILLAVQSTNFYVCTANVPGGGRLRNVLKRICDKAQSVEMDCIISIMYVANTIFGSTTTCIIAGGRDI